MGIETIKEGQTLYWARVHPKLQIFDLYDLRVRTIKDDYFVCFDDKTKQSYIFTLKDIGINIFIDRGDALEHIKEVESNEKI